MSYLERMQKIVVCALHQSFLTQLEDYLTTQGYECLLLSTDADVNLVHKFGQDHDYRVLIVDIARPNYITELGRLKEHVSYGIHILLCE
jgi:DNA-binding response OmpR family regulator